MLKKYTYDQHEDNLHVEILYFKSLTKDAFVETRVLRLIIIITVQGGAYRDTVKQQTFDFLCFNCIC